MISRCFYALKRSHRKSQEVRSELLLFPEIACAQQVIAGIIPAEILKPERIIFFMIILRHINMDIILAEYEGDEQPTDTSADMPLLTDIKHFSFLSQRAKAPQ